MKKAAKALLITFSIVRIFGADSAGWIGIPVLAACLLEQYMAERYLRGRRFFAWAALAAIATVWAEAGRIFGGETHRLYRLFVAAYCLAGIFFLAEEVLKWTCLWFEKKSEKAADRAAVPTFGGGFFWICFGVFLGSFSSYLLLNFPGIVYNDGVYQYEQAAGLAAYSNHQPWVHTMLLKLCLAVGGLFTQDVRGQLFVYTAVQIVVLSLIMAYVLQTANRAGVSRPFLIGGLLFMAFVPYNPLNATVIGKDTLFAAGVLLLSCCLFCILSGCAGSGIRDILLYAAASLVMCLFRSNGWYAYLALSVLLVFFLEKRHRRLLLVNLAVIAAAALVRGPVMGAFEVARPDTAESLSIPLQQIARVYAQQGNIDAASEEYLGHIMDTGQIANYYDPEVSDGIKWLLRFGDQAYLEAHFGGFVSTWFRLLAGNPGIYLDAYSRQTAGYWYPGMGERMYAFYGVAPNEAGLSAVHPIACNAAYAAFDLWFSLPEVLPGYAFFYSPGGTIWGIFVMFAVAAALKKKEFTTPILPHLCVWLTLLAATPVNGDFRYGYCWIMSFPFFLMLFFGCAGERTAEKPAIG